MSEYCDDRHWELFRLIAKKEAVSRGILKFLCDAGELPSEDFVFEHLLQKQDLSRLFQNSVSSN